MLSNAAVDDVLLGPPLVLSSEFVAAHAISTIACDPRPREHQGRYALPPDSFAEVIDFCDTPALSSLGSVPGAGGLQGGHLTAEAVLRRLCPVEDSSSKSSHTTKAESPRFASGVVGSLPRPEFVRELVLGASTNTGGWSSALAPEARLRAAMRNAVAMQLQAGCDVVTDGELGRLSYIGIIAELANGFEIVTLEDGRPYTLVVERLTPKAEGILASEAVRLQEILKELGAPDHPYKLTIPAPALLGERMWQESQDRCIAAYPTEQEFVNDTVSYLARELELACELENPPAVIQIDDPHLCLFVSDDVRAKYPDPEAAADFAVRKTNELVQGLDAARDATGVQICVHLCRRAGGKARGEHAHDGDLSVIVPHINSAH